LQSTEIIATILDYLPVRDLMAFARVSHRLQEMVYDDTRWVTKLQLMGVWNESEARKRFEDAMRRKRAADAAKRAEEEKKFSENRASAAAPRGSTIFDVMEEAEKAKAKAAESQRRNTVAVTAGVDLLSLSSTEISRPPLMDKNSLLTVLKSVRSIRGFARQEFGRIYGALGPLYHDLVRARTHTDPVVFQMYSNPEEQARMLAQLRTFAESDTAMGWAERTDRLTAMMGVFENAALREFEGGFDGGDIDGRMKRYAHVLILLNGGQACIQLFVQKHPVLYEKEELGNPMDCFECVPTIVAMKVVLLMFGVQCSDGGSFYIGACQSVLAEACSHPQGASGRYRKSVPANC
jgi:recyclin-1